VLLGLVIAGDPVDVLPYICRESADQSEMVDVPIDKVEHAVNEGEEGFGEADVAKVEHVVADLEDPIEGEASDDLLDLRGVAGLGEAFGSDGAGKGGDGLPDEAIVTGQKVVEKADRPAIARIPDISWAFAWTHESCS
jgi:hypothetical protein